MKRSILMNKKDNVITVLENVLKDDIVNVYNNENEFLFNIVSNEEILIGNKISLIDMNKGDKVIKYGEIIGEVTRQIKKGYLVHVHNVKSLTVDIPPAFKKEIIRQMRINVKEED